jgi:hypothetical protein
VGRLDGRSPPPVLRQFATWARSWEGADLDGVGRQQRILIDMRVEMLERLACQAAPDDGYLKRLV